jgi:hypothetical protein
VQERSCLYRYLVIIENHCCQDCWMVIKQDVTSHITICQTLLYSVRQMVLSAQTVAAIVFVLSSIRLRVSVTSKKTPLVMAGLHKVKLPWNIMHVIRSNRVLYDRLQTTRYSWSSPELFGGFCCSNLLPSSFSSFEAKVVYMIDPILHHWWIPIYWLDP